MRRNLGAIISVLFIVIIGLLLVFVNTNRNDNSINVEKKEVLVGNYFEFDDDIVVTKGDDNVKVDGNKIEFIKTGEVVITIKDNTLDCSKSHNISVKPNVEKNINYSGNNCTKIIVGDGKKC